MHVKRDAKLRLQVKVPPGDSLVGVYPQELFRIEKIDTVRAQEGLSLVRGGRRVPLDGRVYEVQGHERTLGCGDYLALHVRNASEEIRALELVLSGLSLGGEENVAHQSVWGLFTMESAPSPEPRASSPEPS